MVRFLDKQMRRKNERKLTWYIYKTLRPPVLAVCVHFNDALINAQQFFSVAEICFFFLKVNRYAFVSSDFPPCFVLPLCSKPLTLSLSRYFLRSSVQFQREVWWEVFWPGARGGLKWNTSMAFYWVYQVGQITVSDMPVFLEVLLLAC